MFLVVSTGIEVMHGKEYPT